MLSYFSQQAHVMVIIVSILEEIEEKENFYSKLSEKIAFKS